jgi:hypothetical protein
MKYSNFQQVLLRNTYTVLSLEQNSDFALSDSSVIPAVMPFLFNPCQMPTRTMVNRNQHYLSQIHVFPHISPQFLGPTMKIYIASQMKILQMRTNKG